MSRPYSEVMYVCLDVTYTHSAKSVKEQTGDIITFAQFEEEDLLSETRDDAESSDEFDDDSIMPPLISKEEIDATDSVDESEDEIMSTEMLEEISDGSQSYSSVNRREACQKIGDGIIQGQSEWKRALKYTQNMGKVLHTVFKAVVKEILQDLQTLGESGSEVSFFIPEPRNFAELTILPDNIQETLQKSNKKEIKNIINNQTFLVQYPEKGDTVTPCMDVYNAKILSDGSLDNLKFRIVVRGYMQN